MTPWHSDGVLEMVSMCFLVLSKFLCCCSVPKAKVLFWVAVWTTALDNCAKKIRNLAENFKPWEIFHGFFLVRTY